MTRYIDMYFHLAKDIVLSVISQIFPKRGNMIIRWGFLFLLLVVIHPFLLFYLSPYPILFKISMSLSVFFFYVFVALFFCKLSLFQRGWAKNGVFIIIFLTGIVCYVKLSDVLQTTTASKGNTEIHKTASVDNKAPQQELSWDDVFTAIHHSHTAVAAFFPSRGAYEIEHDGTQGKNKLAADTLWWYMAFHAAVYIFVGYFIMSLWGYRTINRLRFWLTTDREKNVFWCNNPEPKMLKLAKDIIENMQSSRPVFSVEESMIDKPEMLFQEMNYQGYCLKLRKPGQIHEKCLRASRHFFLSENSDWNILMAENLVNARSSKKYNTATKLYIKIENDARKDYYIRWADQYKSQTMEIIFIDECSLIVDKFTKKYHILAAFPECIDENAAVCKENGFKFLIIGFGGLGKEVLKHLICDTQFLDSQGKRVDVRIDIVEKDATQIALFRKQFDDLLTRFNGIQFITTSKKIPIAAGTEKFYSFFELHHKKYDRIIVALGDTAVSVETIAQIENIIRKNIDLSSSDPQGELRAWKNKIFLISPELCDSMFPEEKNNKHDNLFTVIGAGNKIFNYSDIINEDMFKLAQVINYLYSTGTIENVDMTKVEEKWVGADFYDRQSSYAAGLGLENVRLLLGVKDDCTKEEYKKLLADDKLKQRLGKIEHNRWWAYMLGSGYSPWTKPVQRLKEDLKKANQTTNFLRHATMVEWEYLPDMDNAFRNVITISIQQKKRNLAFELSLTALVCDAEPINSAQLPIEGIVSISVFNDGKLSLNREELQKKLEELRSQLEGAVIELEKTPDSADGVMSVKKSGKCFISEKIKDISEKYFAAFSVKEKSPKQTGEYTVNGYKIKTGSIEITEIVKSEDIIPPVEEAPQVKNVEQTLNFSGVLKCSSQWEPSKNFQDKDLELIEDIPTLFKIARGENG